MKPIMLLLATVLLLLLTSAAAAQDGTSLARWTVDGGGQVSGSANGYALSGTIGQPDVGTLTEGGYTLAGGFWGSEMALIELYVPLVLK
jgi:hypothetical protein